MSLHIATFYEFRPQPPEELEARVNRLQIQARERGVLGLVIYGHEGINTTLSGPLEALDAFIGDVHSICELTQPPIKRSSTHQHPFLKFKVKIRDEIVTLGDPALKPDDNETKHHHLSPADWHKMLTEEPDTVVLDTRNWYETRIGRFQKAVVPNLEEFQEFPQYLEKSKLPKDKKILIYCTGGIRCEKAIFEMERQGFNNVWQLDGGILAYLEQFPSEAFEGECFVFDHRVAVDQSLQPTKQYRMCPHCGQPADHRLECVRCDTPSIICVRCIETAHLRTCSKNCAHHSERNPGCKGRPQVPSPRLKPVHYSR